MYIRTDASNVGLGAILCQEYNGKEKVISFASKLLDASQRKLHACEKELLAIMWAVKKFKDYIWGEDFTIITDNNALTYLNKFKDTDTKLGRWAMRMEPYADKIIYRPGKENIVADALSRAPISSSEIDNLEQDPVEMFVPAFSLTYDVPSAECLVSEQKKDCNVESIREKLADTATKTDGNFVLRNDVVFKIVEVPIINGFHRPVNNPDIESGRNSVLEQNRSVREPNLRSREEYPTQTDLPVVQKEHHSGSEDCQVDNSAGPTSPDNVLSQQNEQVRSPVEPGRSSAQVSSRRRRNYHFKEVIYLPQSLRKTVMHLNHDVPESGHMGVRKTINRLVNKVYWPNMRSDIKEYVKTCHICQTVKYGNEKPAGLMGTTTPATAVFQTIFIDFVGPLPRSKSGNQHLLVVQDELSKWVQFFPMRSATARNVAKRLEGDIFCRFGVPDTIVSDHGSEFESKILQKLCKDWGIRHAFTSVYHPSPNQAERTNKTLIQMIRTYIDDDHRTWDEQLQCIALAIRTIIHDTTKVSSSLLNLGREIMLPWDRKMLNLNDQPADPQTLAETQRQKMKPIINWVRENIQKAQTNYKAYYDKRRSNPDYKVDDLILLRNRILSKKDEKIMKKLAPKWLGPYQVKKVVTPITFLIVDDKGKEMGIQHVSNMQKYHARDNSVDSEDTVAIRRPRRACTLKYKPGDYKRLNLGLF